MDVRNGYDGDSETAVNVLAMHTALKTLSCHGNKLVQERSLPRIGCAERGSSTVSIVWQD